MAFNPDQYLEKKYSAMQQGGSAPSGGFDPDAYLAKKSGTTKTPSLEDFADTSLQGGKPDRTQTYNSPIDKMALAAMERVDAPFRHGANVASEEGGLAGTGAFTKALFDKGLRDKAPSWSEVYPKTPVGKFTSSPMIKEMAGIGLTQGPNPGLIPREEFYGENLPAAEKAMGEAPNIVGEIGTGLLTPSNMLAGPVIKGLGRANKMVSTGLVRGGEELGALTKARGAEALASERGSIGGGLPPEPPPGGGDVPTISDAQVDTVRGKTPAAPQEMPTSGSIRDLEGYVSNAERAGESTHLPKIDEIRDAQSRIKDLKHPLQTAQELASASPDAGLKFGTLRKSGTKTSDTIAKLERLQKAELESKIDDAINGIHPEKAASTDAVAGGRRLQDDFTTQYRKRQKELGKAFQEYDGIEVGPSDNAAITDKLAEHIPQLRGFIEVGEGGATIKPYSRAMGISKDEHRVVSEIVDTLNKEDLTVKQIRNIRGTLLREYPDPLSRPPIVQQVRSALLDHLKDVISTKTGPQGRAAVMKTFKDYAVNEQNLSELEKVFGGSFSEFARPGKTVVPEKVLDRMFSDTKSAGIARNALGEKAFNAALADYLSMYRQKFTKDGSLSAAKFGSWLQTKEPVLWEVANPNDVLRLVDLNTLHRAVDLPPVNPSGTAASTITLMDMMTNPVASAGKKAKEILDVRSRERGASKLFDELNIQPKKPGMIERGAKGLLGDEPVALAKKFLKDEEGAFTPSELRGLLNKEGTYDLKKAREVAGPAKTNPGLLGAEPSVSKITDSKTSLQASAQNQEDTAHAVADILIKNKRTGFQGKIDPRDADFLAEIAGKTQDEALLGKINEALTPTEQKGALLTNLNVEKKRGPKVSTGDSGEILPFEDPQISKKIKERESTVDRFNQESWKKEKGLLVEPPQFKGKKAPRAAKPISPVDSLIARYGDDKKTVSAIKKAQRSDAGPYVSDPNVSGIGWAPNMKAEPTGVIGEPRILEPHSISYRGDGLKKVDGLRDTDPLKWADNRYGATKQLIQKHKDKNLPLTINTSSDLVAHADYIDAMPGKTTVNMHLLPDHDHLNRILFPGNPSRKRQMEAIERLRAAGVRVNAVEPTFETFLDAVGGADRIRKQTGQSLDEIAKILGLKSKKK